MKLAKEHGADQAILWPKDSMCFVICVLLPSQHFVYLCDPVGVFDASVVRLANAKCGHDGHAGKSRLHACCSYIEAYLLPLGLGTNASSWGTRHWAAAGGRPEWGPIRAGQNRRTAVAGWRNSCPAFGYSGCLSE